ncbi:MAG: ComEC/Rec2 family competence protein [Proteobacteria bacterium]|nr:ComEC/Rec2 family competence protein [Pseudomonadota bacterium]
MGLLNALCVGSMIGFLFSGRYSYPLQLFKVVELSLPFLFLLMGLRAQWAGLLSAAWLCMWVCLHSPRPWDQEGKNQGLTVSSNGCGLITDDLLVSIGGKIWLHRGRATKGDVVSVGGGRRSYGNIPPAMVIAPSPHSTVICGVASNIRKQLMDSFAIWPQGQREWLQSFVLGADSKVDEVTLGALRKLGLLHIVVLSGGHLTVLSNLFLLFFRFAPLIFFSMRMITMKTWTIYWRLTSFFGVAAIILFSFAAGLSQSIQRALLLFILLQIVETFLGAHTRWVRIRLAWVLQCLLFPIHLFSLTNLLTWTGSLILNAHITSRFRKSMWFALKQDVVIQLSFAVASVLVFGQIGVFSIAANILMAPLFSAALWLNFGLFFFGYGTGFAKFAIDFQMLLLAVARRLSSTQMEYSGLTVYCPKMFSISTPIGQACIACLILFLIWRIYRRDEMEL